MRPFDSAEYQRRTQSGTTGNECCICGRQCGETGHAWAVVNHCNMTFGTVADMEGDKKDEFSMYPIGPECAKKVKKAHPNCVVDPVTEIAKSVDASIVALNEVKARS